MLSKKLILGGIAAIMLLLGAGAAMAAPGRAISTVNVRSGPGTGYAIVGSLTPGERVDIAKCEDGWCYVGRTGTDGWVANAYLERVAVAPIYVPPPVVVRPHIVVRPPIYHRPPPHRPPHRPPHKPGKPGKPRPPICNGKPQIQICRPR